MIYTLLDTIQLLGLFMFMSGPLFYGVIWRAVYADEAISVFMHKRVFASVLVGGVLFITVELIGLIVAPVSQSFLPAPVPLYIQMVGLFLTVVYITIFHRKSIHDSWLYYLSMLILAVIILLTISITTHAAKEQGVLPLGSNLIHLAATVVWGGGLLYLMIVPWRQLQAQPAQYGSRLWQVIDRFTNLTISMLAITLITGAILTFVHVHSSVAMETTQYGQLLKLKILVVTLLVVMVLMNLLKFIPALKGGLVGSDLTVFSILLKRYRIISSLQALIILILLVISSNLTRYEPPDTAPFLNPQSWSMSVGSVTVTVEMRPVAGSTNNVRFEIFLPETGPLASESSFTFNLYLIDSGVGTYGNEAVQVSSNSFLGEGVFAKPGDWRFELNWSGNAISASTHDLVLLEQPLQEDIKVYLSFHAIGYTLANSINVIVGSLLVMTFCWLVWQSRTGTAPPWVTVAGLSGMGVGLYMIFSVMLVKSYPSTFWPNPEEYSADTILRGKNSFIEHCAECHGETGKGDGQWAIEQQRQILDLASPHLDVHTDGEIFWWITHGIPSLDMTPLGDQISEQQRWWIINYIRSLRHGIP